MEIRKDQVRSNFIFVFCVFLFAVLMRLLPHELNFVPITAVGIFLSSIVSFRSALLVVLFARLVSDYFFGFFDIYLMSAVYASHLIGVVFGRFFIKGDGLSKYGRVGGVSVLSAVVFFLITNLVIFYQGMYEVSLVGQISSYVNALPFFRATLFSDVVFSFSLFLIYDLYRVINPIVVKYIYAKKSCIRS